MVDALVTWEFWAGVLLAGIFALAALLRWILLGDGCSPTQLSPIDSPLPFQQSPPTHAQSAAAVAQHLPAPDRTSFPTTPASTPAG
ncbi:MAG: hypothetical protein QN152_03350 [Armatimonadota bacterium]|nr:hypothetical protein [Armatimonadota bacterium]MDR7427062.1 hypothetical protein [Armatimonadota bacterium]MDR7465522.1 hypothetical protein [Armatimonadota bacterium]MDR7474830.1 hypothetical protein [Armatimonadota bacterium]MDR7538553.1 hypothetical protein [Armatimonadota bacterium]